MLDARNLIEAPEGDEPEEASDGELTEDTGAGLGNRKRRN